MKRNMVTRMGLDAHRTFSVVTGRDAEGNIVGRRRLDQRSHPTLIAELAQFPQGDASGVGEPLRLGVDKPSAGRG